LSLSLAPLENLLTWMCYSTNLNLVSFPTHLLCSKHHKAHLNTTNPPYFQVTGNRLLFTAVNEENAGKYQCRAHIAGGFLDTSALLSVEPAKRKRKHTSNSTSRMLRSQRRKLRRRHRRRHSSGESSSSHHSFAHVKHGDQPHSAFGSWFAS
jgi:hypothetical protein